MSWDLALRVMALCVMLASAETLHGIVRTVYLVRRLGKARALKLSIVTGSLLALAICYLVVPGLGLSGPAAHLALGLVLALFMASFDVLLGLTLMRRSWHKVMDDFRPSTGNYLAYGLGLLVFFPLLVNLLHSPR